jgi:hypothetical protein
MNAVVQPIGSRAPEGLFFDLEGNVAELVSGTYDSFTVCNDAVPLVDPLCVDPVRWSPGSVFGSSTGSTSAVTEATRRSSSVTPPGFRCAYPYEAAP